MSQNEKNVSPGGGANPVDNSASTTPAQPPANMSAALNPGATVTETPGETAQNAVPAAAPTTVPVENAAASGAATLATPANPPQAVAPASPANPVAQAAAPAVPAPAAPKAEAPIVKVNSYIPGGLSKDVVNPIENPAQTDQNFPFAAGHRMHEVAQYQNFFTFPLDTYYNVFDAVYYFSDEKNRNRYTYDQQQLIISRIVRAALDFGIPIEGITEKLMI